jgi:hypothetical protein
MKVTALRTFRYSVADHHQGEIASKGDVIEIADDAFPGLQAEGYVTDEVNEPPEAIDTIQIPEAWRDLNDKELKKLAANFGKFKTRDEMVAGIEAELVRRAELAAK